jgi:hypothetical protein
LIRITQSYLIRKIAEYLSNSDYTILYTDYPQASRGGVGSKAIVHNIFETKYDRAPDILAFDRGRILLVEVNNKLEKRYIDKFHEYERQSSVLISELQEKLNLEVAAINYGFGMKKRTIETNALKSLSMPLTIFFLDSKNNVAKETLKMN